MVVHGNRDRPPPARVVVLGASGFVGKALARELAHAAVPSLLLSSAAIDLTAGGAADRLRALLRSDDAVVMLAAITRDRGNDRATFMKNVAMGAHVADAVGAGCAHLVYVSSDAVYGEAPVNPVVETSPCVPTDLYGLMHVVRERILADAAQDSSTPYLVLRPSILYGPDDTHGSYGPNAFFRSALATRTLTLFGNGEDVRDHVDVEDLARLMTLALAHRSQGTLNVATGVSIDFARVAALVQTVAGPLRIASRPRQIGPSARVYDTAATRVAFPSFTYTPLAVGLEKTWRALTARLAEQPRA